MDSTHLEQLESNLDLFKCGRIRKLFKAPQKIIRSKALQIVSQLRTRGINTTAKLFFDAEMTTIFPEEVSVALWLYGFYEEGLTKALLEHLKPGMVFVDVGAHFGYYTLLASRIVGDEGQVHAFEPTPSTFQVLRSNTAGCRNVWVNTAALASERAMMTLSDYGLRFAGRNTLYRARSNDGSMKGIRPQKYQVQTVTLDDYVQEIGVKPDFLKIDAENAEYAILRGSERTLTKSRPILSVEVGDVGIKELPTSKDLVSFLSEKGYQAYEFRGGSFSKHSIRDWYDWDNILFLPN